jgi:AcrR family transcriptional regulator
MDFAGFREKHDVSVESICRKIFRENRESIKIRKEETAVRNLVTIFSAPLELGMEKGFNAMTLRDLSQKTGLSMGCLYSYFSGKDELFDLVQNQGRMAGREILESALKDITEPVERLRAAIRSHLYLSEEMQKWFYFSYMETKNLSRSEHRNAIESELYTEQIFADIVESGRISGKFRVSEIGRAHV